jgi:hypothetical protein
MARNSGGGCFALLFGGTFSIAMIVVALMIGPWCLQYDLNHWLPVLHANFAGIQNKAPVPMSFGLFIVGLIGFEIAVPVAIITCFLTIIGVIA